MAIHITHGVPPPRGAPGGARRWRNALPYMPVGVHLAVVDPGVGTMRRAVALRHRAGGSPAGGPDNGLLWLAAERFGGVSEAVDVGLVALAAGAGVGHLPRPRPVCSGGRPSGRRRAAGRGRGAPPRQRPDHATGAAQRPAGRRRAGGARAGRRPLREPGPERRRREQLAQAGLRLGQALELEAGGRRVPARYALTFADVAEGEALVYEDAYRSLAVAVNRGSAAEVLGVGTDDRAAHRAGVSGLGRPRLHLRVADRPSAPASSPAPARRMARSSPHASRPPGAVARDVRWQRPPGRALLMLARVARLDAAAAAGRRRGRGRRPQARRADEVAQRRAGGRPQGGRHPGQGRADQRLDGAWGSGSTWP